MSLSMKIIFSLIAGLSLTGCVDIGVYVIDTASPSKELVKLESQSTTIPRPTSIVDDGTAVYLLGRKEPGFLSVEVFAFNGEKVA